MPWSTHVTVATVIERNGRFLLVEEHSDGIVHPVYNQPAGHVEAGETLLDAALRETLEETGWQATLQHLIGIYSYTPPMVPDRTYYRFCFAAQAHEQLTTQLDPDILRAVWLTRDELMESARSRSPLVLQAIDDYLSGKCFPLSLIHEFAPALPCEQSPQLSGNLC